MKNALRSATVVGIFCLAGCAPRLPMGTAAFEPVPFATLRNWPSEDFKATAMLMSVQCKKILDLPATAHLGGEKRSLPSGSLSGDWQPACRALVTKPPVSADAAKTFFETWFTPYYVNARGHVDGFSEVEVKASRTQQGAFQTPIYAKPDDLVRTPRGSGNWISGRWQGTHFEPYYTRAEINNGALLGRVPVIAWLSSPADLFVLQLQGSGRLMMEGGDVMHIAYAARNGRPYTPLGRYLVDKHYIAPDQINIFKIRDWLNKYPVQAQDILAQNADYVFFKTLPQESLSSGAPGVMGIGLTPVRSLRSDPGYIPFSAPVWLEASLPRPSGGAQQWRHLTFMQDANSGMDYGKVSLFTGWGRDADTVAAQLDSPARLFVLLPRRASQ